MEGAVELKVRTMHYNEIPSGHIEVLDDIMEVHEEALSIKSHKSN